MNEPIVALLLACVFTRTICGVFIFHAFNLSENLNLSRDFLDDRTDFRGRGRNVVCDDGRSFAQAIEATGDALHACRAEEQGAEFFSERDCLADRRREHVEEFCFVGEEVLHFCRVALLFVVGCHAFRVSEMRRESNYFFR